MSSQSPPAAAARCPVELKHYRVDDIDRAAIAFPDLTFEIVHAGIAFLEETAWQLARFERVREVLAEVDGVGSVEVTVDARAEWWPGMMAVSARQRLRAVRPLPVVAVRRAR